MAYLTSIIKTVVRELPKMEGTAGKISLGKGQLAFMGEKGKALSKVLSGVDASAVDIAYKSKANYSIAAFRLRDGKKVVGQGALSIQNPATDKTILKYRAAVGENGNIATSNGYVNSGVAADSRDMSFGLTRRGGKISYDAEIGKTFVLHANADEKALTDLCTKINPKCDITKQHWKLQQKMDETLQKFRKIVKCEKDVPFGGEKLKHAEFKKYTGTEFNKNEIHEKIAKQNAEYGKLRANGMISDVFCKK